VVIDDESVLALRAEDESGSFGILPGHADFLTALPVSVITWTGSGHARRYCALRGGLLTVTGGTDIAIATREAVVGTDLATLDQTVLIHFRADIDSERAEHFQATRLQLDAIRQIVSHLRPPGPGGVGDFA
jgi:F-type H+-transporting ATPase subunit epsilon